MSEQIVIPYWQKKGRFSPEGVQDIHWDAIGVAMQQSTNPHRQWITKRASRECGANQVLHKRKVKQTDQCPLCQQVETVTHILQCQDTRARRQWEMSIQELRRWMENKDTAPVIIDALCKGLHQWQLHGYVEEHPNDILISTQNIIGWNGVLEGCFSHKWSEYQDHYFQDIKSRRSGFKWQVDLCKRIWQIPWDMWQHRNNIEHATDQQKLLQQIQIDVQEELVKGNDNDLDIERFLQEATQENFIGRTIAYKKGWLRGIQALRARKQRRGLGDRVLHNMRRVMRNFLSR